MLPKTIAALLPLAALLALFPTSASEAVPATRQESAAATTSPAVTALELLARPVVLGASMSSAFGIPKWNDSELDLGHVLARTLKREEPIPSKASEMFFVGPIEMGSEQGDYALDAEATIVFAIDYLFWFGYGTGNADGGVLTSEAERLELLEVGLDYLDQLDCPVVVSDFPDMSNSVGRMLMESQMPSQETLRKLTARVREWAAERENTLVVPLASLVAALNSDEAVRAGNFTFPANSRSRLIQRDELHPTLTGLCLLAHVVGKQLVDQGLLPAESVELDVRKVMTAFELDTEGVEPATD